MRAPARLGPATDYIGVGVGGNVRVVDERADLVVADVSHPEAVLDRAPEEGGEVAALFRSGVEVLVVGARHVLCRVCCVGEHAWVPAVFGI